MKIIDHKTDDTKDHSYVPWWSLGKTVIATCIFRLVELDKLSLEEQYLDLACSLKDLLRHESGLTDYGRYQDYHDAVDQQADAWSVCDMLKRSHATTLLFSPGQGWSYSNIGYYYLRILIEETTKVPLQEALNQLVFKKIGIEHVTVAEARADLKQCTLGVRKGYDPKWVYHGLLLGSLKNACIFMDKLCSGHIISQSSLKVMLEPYTLNIAVTGRPWKIPAYAYGLMMDKQEGCLHAYGHTGAGPSSVIAVYHFPNGKLPITLGLIKNTDDQGMVERDLIKAFMTDNGLCENF